MEKENCAFCDKTQFEEQIIAETDDFWIIASLGQITDGGYTLLIPKEHVPCMAELDLVRSAYVVAMSKKIRDALTKEFRFNPYIKYPITAFEHGIVGQSVKHAHLHFLPAVLDLTPRVLADFSGCERNEISSYMSLRNLFLDHKEPYLFWTSQNGKGNILWNPPAPKQCFRFVSAELLGRPERANWRDMDPELDKRLWWETVRKLKPYF